MKYNMTSGQQLVRSEFEKGRQLFDADTQQLWDRWFSESYQRHAAAIEKRVEQTRLLFVEQFNEAVKHVNWINAELNALIENHNDTIKAGIKFRADISELSADLKILDRQFMAEITTRNIVATKATEDMVQVRKDVSVLMDQVRDTALAIQKIQKDAHNDISEWTKRLDRSFAAEIATMRNVAIAKASDDLSTMRSDLIEILKSELVDVAIKMRSDIYKEMFADLKLEVKREMTAEVWRVINVRKKFEKSQTKPKPQQQPKPKPKKA